MRRHSTAITTSIDDANGGDDGDGAANMAEEHKHIPRNQPEDKCHSPVCRNCRRTRARRRRSSEGFARMRQSWRPRLWPMPKQELWFSWFNLRLYLLEMKGPPRCRDSGDPATKWRVLLVEESQFGDYYVNQDRQHGVPRRGKLCHHERMYYLIATYSLLDSYARVAACSRLPRSGCCIGAAGRTSGGPYLV